MHDTNREPTAEQSIREMLAPFIKPHMGALVFAVAINAFHGIAISFQALMPKYLIDNALLASGISTSQRWQRVAALVAAYLVGTIVFRMLIWHWSYRIFARIREAVVFGLRARFFRHINELCIRFHGRYNSGELFSYIFGSPLAQVQQYFQQLAILGPGGVFTLVSSIIWVFTWDWLMTLVLFGSIVSSVCLMALIRRRIQALHKEFQFVEGNVSGHIADLIRGHRDVKLYAMEEQVIDQFQAQASLIGQKSVARDIRSHMQIMRAEGMNYVFFAILCTAGAWRYLNHALTLGELQGYLASFIALQMPMNWLLQITTLRGGAQASLERLNVVLKTVSTTPDPENPVPQIPVKSDLVIRDVHFSYEQEPTLTGINLRIPYGQRIALVGPSGSGKTTLAQLILRFYMPDSGTFCIGDCDIRDCRGADLRRMFGVVPQDPYFFRTTLRDNIRLARTEATDGEIRRVCEMANAWEFIAAMPAGLGTSVGEGGSTLSGGQKQRLAIARALLNDPPYFIFDEATSALDNISEKLIQESLDRVLQGRTALFIAHRLATVRTCDRIIVMKKGCIVQDGSYEELVNQPGLFKTMVESDELRG
jgi:ABC-type multidrug transport system fused ATPase/permease subunit